ncbi:hypothetical protein ACTFIY_010522 [Dictyostelium cf. discoideum]
MNSKTQGIDILFFKVWHNITIRKIILGHMKHQVVQINDYYTNNWKRLMYDKQEELYNRIFDCETIVTPEIRKINDNISRLYKEYKNNLKNKTESGIKKEHIVKLKLDYY